MHPSIRRQIDVADTPTTRRGLGRLWRMYLLALNKKLGG